MCLSISCVNIQSQTSIFQKKTSFYRLAESQFHIKTFTKLYRFCDAFFFYCASLCIFEVKIPCVTQSIYRAPHTRTAREAMKIKRVSKLLESAYSANKSTLIYFPEAYWRLQQRVPLPPFFFFARLNKQKQRLQTRLIYRLPPSLFPSGTGRIADSGPSGCEGDYLPRCI